MNWGVLGLVLVAIALGVACGACWRFRRHPVTRWTPSLLALAYYLALWLWPHAAILAARAGRQYPTGDQVRMVLLGVALLVAVIGMTIRLVRLHRENTTLRAQVARLENA
ncbi:hypothetical protein K7W42_07715 [Deinococcus sp. HMF7604]|uniref:hypothetical protein n=1 Tax=Deinococcus betulae TaxID=2873312 RepID=UPI001CCD2493|nr:hypothetical protein [Deinococcus betulae]MBZ9750746.1 hypothetical protein [Deinococcus betulae]